MTIASPRLEIILYSIVIILLVFILFLMMNKSKEHFAISVTAPIPPCPVGYILEGYNCKKTKECPANFTFNSEGNCIPLCPPNFTFKDSNCILSSCPQYFTLNNDKKKCDLSSCPPKLTFDSKLKICKGSIIEPKTYNGKKITCYPNCGTIINDKTIINPYPCTQMYENNIKK